MTHDRTHYRAMPMRLLIEAARESRDELTIALGERLEDCEGDDDIIADLIAERDELYKRCDLLRKELEELRDAMDLD